MDITDNGNISSNELTKGGLHFSSRGFAELTINSIRRIKKFAKTLGITGSFHMASNFDSQINVRPGNIENSDESVINQLNGTYSQVTFKNDAWNKETSAKRFGPA